MEKEYELRFHKEISRVLEEIYYKSINDVLVRRANVQTEIKYVQYLVDHSLVKILPHSGGNIFALELQTNGYEVFEKYKGWDDYKKKVVDYKSKIEKSKELAIKLWWVPILISFIALLISLCALFK